MESDAESNARHEEGLVKPVKSWKGYLWDTWEYPKDQRRLLFKLDAFVLTFASVSQITYTSFQSRRILTDNP